MAPSSKMTVARVIFALERRLSRSSLLKSETITLVVVEAAKSDELEDCDGIVHYHGRAPRASCVIPRGVTLIVASVLTHACQAYRYDTKGIIHLNSSQLYMVTCRPLRSAFARLV